MLIPLQVALGPRAAAVPPLAQWRARGCAWRAPRRARGACGVSGAVAVGRSRPSEDQNGKSMGKSWISWVGFSWLLWIHIWNSMEYTIWLFDIAMEKWPIEIDGLPINSMVDLSSSQTVSHNQRVSLYGLHVLVLPWVLPGNGHGNLGIR